jgi:lipid-A-disaccharide synthase
MAMVAGEASGDLLASLMMQGIQARWAATDFVGIGGPLMHQRGFDAWWPMHKLAVRGYVEVLRHYREIIGIRQQLLDRLLSGPPDLFIGVDAPDFNLDLSRQLKSKGIKSIQFVCPSIWAWRPHRVQKIRESVDHVLCLFPFEPDLLASHGIDATYVGHPLAQMIPNQVDKMAVRAQLRLGNEDLVLGVLPGSRLSEIEQMTVRFLDAARILAKQHASLKVLLPMAPGTEDKIKELAKPYMHSLPLILLNGKSHDVLAAADVALVASGTATLEAALFKCPMVIAYSMSWVSWQIMKRQRLQPWVGLPNILCSEFVVPELLQSDANPLALAGAVQSWLDQPQRMDLMRSKFQTMHDLLRKDTATLSADAIQKVLAA